MLARDARLFFEATCRTRRQRERLSRVPSKCSSVLVRTFRASLLPRTRNPTPPTRVLAAPFQAGARGPWLPTSYQLANLRVRPARFTGGAKLRRKSRPSCARVRRAAHSSLFSVFVAACRGASYQNAKADSGVGQPVRRRSAFATKGFRDVSSPLSYQKDKHRTAVPTATRA